MKQLIDQELAELKGGIIKNSFGLADLSPKTSQSAKKKDDEIVNSNTVNNCQCSYNNSLQVVNSNDVASCVCYCKRNPW